MLVSDILHRFSYIYLSIYIDIYNQLYGWGLVAKYIYNEDM